MITTPEKLAALRTEMQAQALDGFIIPLADEYQGEFTPEYAQRLKWLTGFTGSGGIAAVLQDRAVVLTDGRYLIQIVQQVDGDHFETGNMITDPLENWLSENTTTDAVIGYDPRLHTPAQIEKMASKGLHLKATEQNPIDAAWPDQPSPPQGSIELFSDDLAGATAAQKKMPIANTLREKDADSCIITLPDSIAWLLNVRGADVECTPSVLSYAIIYKDDRPITWAVNPDKLEPAIRDALSGVADVIHPQDLGKTLNALSGTIMLDFKRSPLWFKTTLEQGAAILIDAEDPCIAPKAIKSKAEQSAIKKAHELDAIALVKFLHWAENSARSASATEIDVAEKIKEFRAQHGAFKGISFPTIAGFGENGAIVHYRATPDNNAALGDNGLLLVDSGGQYYDPENGIAGTTDITRTIAIGTPTDEMRQRFTLVLKGHIDLAKAQFPQGTTGAQIDTLARQPLWSEGLDFAHGTGHGVGCYLAVHEEAASISPRGTQAFEAGMLISNEPGYYQEGDYGIRIENLVLVQEGQGGMLSFETISFAPIDRSLIVAEMLDDAQKAWLDAYHAHTYDVVAPHVDADVREWLAQQCAPL
jgi:Xaa-Pro aminopeptidase